MAWYRTYRPQNISQLNQPAIRSELERIRVSGTFHHAYVLTGPKGIGKTTTARILAKMVNCEKNAAHVENIIHGKQEKKPFEDACLVCNSCVAITTGRSLCVTEMDAASNRGIDDIRALRERVYMTPPDGRVSVYIIDEVHMLTTEAFNALLKILEEPPAHVLFVLATTELQKVPATIVSRCILLQYKQATVDEIVAVLEKIAKQEKVKVDADVFLAVAKASDGSFRDAVKLFEQMVAGRTTLSLQDIESTLPSSYHAIAQKLAHALQEKNVSQVVEQFAQMHDQQLHASALQKETLSLLHQEMVASVQSGNAAASLRTASLMKSILVAPQPLLPIEWLPFEIACVQWCVGEGDHSTVFAKQTNAESKQTTMAQTHPKEVTIDRKQSVFPKKTEQYDTRAEPEETGSKQRQKSASVPQEMKKDATTHSTEKPILSQQIEHIFDVVEKQWSTILSTVKKTNASLEALLRAARPASHSDSAIIIEVFYPFHKEQLETNRYRLVLEKTIGEMVQESGRVQVQFVLGEKKKQPIKDGVKSDGTVTAAGVEQKNSTSGAVPVADDQLAQAATEALW